MAELIADTIKEGFNDPISKFIEIRNTSIRVFKDAVRVNSVGRVL